AKGYLSGMDLVVAGRMHACIGAFSTGTPVVPVAYSRKFNGLFGTIGYGDYIDGKAQSTDEAVAKVMSAVEDQASLAEGIRKGLLVANERLERYIERLAGILARQP
ncbi:polysaccharide pyruvyl transferase family protein, partial [Vibrio parahaemolyticus]|uniref:polysaccharide pyruvyl transferase family protein n=1 Tax=Vibrio parahaemolyticus TaxID=670 RepID=UPI001EE9BCA6